MSGTGEHILEQPLDGMTVLRRKRALKRELLDRDVTRRPLRVAILAGSTSGEVRDMLELFLLEQGIEASFYESDYDRVFEEALFDHERLDAFKPELIYVHTTVRNLKDPSADETFERFSQLWERLQVRYNCPIIQNNFELPGNRPLGHLDGVDAHGTTHQVRDLNRRFAEAAEKTTGLYIHDLHYLAASYGLQRWHDEKLWCLAKSAIAQAAIPELAHSVARIVRAIFIGASKCLVLDLDNTVWGGIIGEDGVESIKTSEGDPAGEAYRTFQAYCLELKKRGVILAVCSKNDEEIALEGIDHPDCLFSRDDFATFVANWEPKPLNMQRIAETLEIGIDSLVFIDDNPMERAAVRAQAPGVIVPEVEADPLSYIEALDKNGYFDTASFSKDDVSRSDYYRKNAQRKQHATRFESYDDFLKSLEMEAEMGEFSDLHMPRIVQLINKTNQFNLTTQRMTDSEVAAIARSPHSITLYGRLADKFGDNGLVSVMIGTVDAETVQIDTWLMSCRVLRRGFEETMLDQFLVAARERGLTKVTGRYIPTRKNGMVEDLYARLGFDRVSADSDGTTSWELDLTEPQAAKERWIRIVDGQQQPTSPRRASL